MLTKLACRNTDATRRAAMQLALQLPEEISEARAVLDQTGELLEGFLIRAPRKLWNRSSEPDLRGLRLAHGRALLWTMAMLVFVVPVALAVAALVGVEIAAGFVMFAGVAVCSLVLGQLYGVVFSLSCGLASNLLLVAPFYELTVPTRNEMVRVVGFIALAVLLPALANSARQLRGLALSAGGVLSCPPAAEPELPEPDQAAVCRLSPGK